jgi:hypothetical protein
MLQRNKVGNAEIAQQPQPDCPVGNSSNHFCVITFLAGGLTE